MTHAEIALLAAFGLFYLYFMYKFNAWTKTLKTNLRKKRPKPFGYYILEKHSFKEYPNGIEFKQSPFGWVKSSKRLYHTIDRAEAAAKDMEKLPQYNGEWVKTEFKIIKLYTDESF